MPFGRDHEHIRGAFLHCYESDINISTKDGSDRVLSHLSTPVAGRIFQQVKSSALIEPERNGIH